MKFLMLFLMSSIAMADEREDPHYYRGEDVTICEKPTTVYHMQDVRGAPYFLNYGSMWPKNYLTVIIWERDIPDLEINPVSYFQSEDICINGNISMYNQKPQIILRDPGQITAKTQKP